MQNSSLLGTSSTTSLPHSSDTSAGMHKSASAPTLQGSADASVVSLSSRIWNNLPSMPSVSGYLPSLYSRQQSNETAANGANTKEMSIQPSAQHLMLFAMYGENLARRVMSKYGFDKKAELLPIETEIIRALIAAQVTIKDLEEFLIFLGQLNFDSSQAKTLLSNLTPAEFEKLVTVAKTKKFNEFSPHEQNQLMSYFREDLYDKGIRKPIEFSDEALIYSQKNFSVEQQIEFYKDLKVLEHHNEWKSFKNAHIPALAAAEYMSRKPAYSTLKPGMIIPMRDEKTNEPVFFEVKNGIDEKGFAVFILAGVAPQNRNKIRVLCRGTVPSDKDSCIHNLANASGLDKFREHQAAIINMIEEACKAGGDKVYLEFNGHSQGACISQHACAALAERMKNSIKDMTSPLAKLQEINIKVWNPPATTEAIALQFADDAAYLANHPYTTHCIFDFNYCIVDTDVVSKCGEVFLGRFRKSNNVSVQTYHFEPPVPHTQKPILGPHCAPVLVDRQLSKYTSRVINCTKHLADERMAAFKTQKYLELLKFLKIIDIWKSLWIRSWQAFLKNIPMQRQRKPFWKARILSRSKKKIFRNWKGCRKT